MKVLNPGVLTYIPEKNGKKAAIELDKWSINHEGEYYFSTALMNQRYIETAFEFIRAEIDGAKLLLPLHMNAPLLRDVKGRPLKTPTERGLTASTDLRIEPRFVATAWDKNNNPSMGTTKDVLQQKWYGPSGDEWVDVPKTDVKV
jgi:hypothetical protein